MNTITLIEDVMTLRRIAGPDQVAAILEGGTGEEGEFFREKIAEYAERFLTMPKVYEQDGKGDEAVAYLHYFTGGMDWYITERDTIEIQDQAFGLADLGCGAELGYISIVELIQNGVELDLHWEPKTLGAIKGGAS